jgi:CDP-diacylglycerol---glycerol-3-phosphate 3-phosphatidyltransferase
VSDSTVIPAGLQRRWTILAAASLIAWATGLWILRGALPPTQTRAWAVASAITLAYVLIVSHRSLRLNHRPGEARPLEVLGPGNALTLLRGTLIGLLAGFLLMPRPTGWLGWVPAALYSLVEVGDFLDGYLARATHTATRLGERLDIEFDALGLLIATALVVHWGTVPPAFLLVGVARYAYLVGLWWEQRRGRAIQPLPESDLRRPIAGVMMVFVSVLLWPIVPPAAARAAGWVIGLPFLAGFSRDYLVVSGRLSPASPAYLRWRARVKRVLHAWLPPVLRVLVLLGWVLATESMLLDPSMPPAGRWVVILTAIPVVLLVLGIAGRLAALGATILSAVAMVLVGPTPLLLLLMTASLGLLLTGTGPGSLWRGDSFLVDWRPGTPRPLGD